MTVQQDYLFQVKLLTQCALLLFGAVVLAGCAVSPPSVTEPAPTVETAVDPQKNPRVTELLGQAERAISNKRLTTPLDDNAYFRFLQVLSIEPDNTVAQTGIARIVEIYLEWSIIAIERKQYRKATDMLNKARSIDPEHPDIFALEARIEHSRNSARTLYKLSSADLAARSPKLVARLHEIGRIVERRDAKVIITAKSDRAGRWIYQQLNDASINRVRATFQIGQQPSVQLTHP